MENEAKELLEKLVKVENLENLDELFLRYIKVILNDLRSGCEFWNIYTPEFNIFRGCFLHAVTAIQHFLNLVYPIFEVTMNETADAEVRLKQFFLLSEYLCNQRNEIVICEKEFIHFIDLLFTKIIVPGLVWSVGRTAEAIRTASVCCICSLFYKIQNDIHFKDVNIANNNEETTIEPLKSHVNNENFSEHLKKIMPILITLIDDNSKQTRLYSLEAISLAMSIGFELGYVMEEDMNKICYVVLKRLDDGDDDVRCTAIKALKEVWKALPKDYDLNSCRSHVDTLYTSALVHLDDPEKKFQDQILGMIIYHYKTSNFLI